MKFSESYGIQTDGTEDWFDPILNVDTPLFVDPFLIYGDADTQWSRSHDKVIAHFDRAFKLLAESDANPKHLKYQAALNLLTFPEPREFCLGYTEFGTRGSGSGRQQAGLIADAMCDAIARGVRHLEHFEELGIFQVGIGPDRISDTVCTVLKPDFVDYTQKVATELGIELVDHPVRAAGFHRSRTAPAEKRVLQLPTNKLSGGPVILVPKRFLSDLPALNADDWFSSSDAEAIRAELNIDVMTRVSKRDIVFLARRHPGSVVRWRQRLEKQKAGEPYNFDADPKGVYQWHDATRDYVSSHPQQLAPPCSEAEFLVVIEAVVNRFKHFIEEKGGWRLLWNDNGTPKNETAAQLAFQGIASAYCEANNIVLDREVELGRGPVDFKFSNGYRQRALLEVKKLDNGRFWNGLRVQLPSYLESDQCSRGWLMAIRYHTGGVSRERARILPREVAVINRHVAAEGNDTEFRFAMIDARRKPSASKLTPDGLSG